MKEKYQRKGRVERRRQVGHRDSANGTAPVQRILLKISTNR